MNTQTSSEAPVQMKKSKFRIVLPIVILLVITGIAVFLATSFKVITVSGRGESFILDTNKTQVGILYIEENASAFFREKSHWIGPVISKEGELFIQNDVTLTGPVVLFSNGLQLGENATLDGNLVLFAGSLTLKPGAVVRHNVVLFAGSAILGREARVRGDVIAFAGSVVLHEKASLRGDAVLFAGSMQAGREAIISGKLVTFAGGLDMAPKAVLRNDAILFAGDVNLSPEAQVKGDVILTAGSATLKDIATISGRLYLNPKIKSGTGQLFSSSKAQILGGVVKPENIDTIAGLRVAEFFLGYAILLVGLLVVAVVLLMALMFYLGRRSKLSKDQSTQANSPKMSTEPMMPDLVRVK